MPRDIVTTIVSPAAVRDLAKLSDVQDDWGIADQSVAPFLSRAITRCSRAAEEFCDRVFALETVQDMVFLPHDAWPHALVATVAPLQLSRWPVVAVTSVVVDGIALTEGVDFIVDQGAGQLRRRDADGCARAWTGAVVTVIYSAGYVLPGQDEVAGAQDLPPDIQDAVSRMVYTRYAERQRDPLVKSEYVDGVGRTEYLEPSSDGNLSPDVEDILDNYRVPVIS